MDITLSPETQKLLEEKLSSGAYRSADDVLHAALEALNGLETDSLDPDTLDAIDKAEDQIERQELHNFRDVREQLRARFLGS